MGIFFLFHKVSFGQLKKTEFTLTIVPCTAVLESYLIVISDFFLLKMTLVVVLFFLFL